MMLIGLLLLLLLGVGCAQVGREEVESLRYLFESTAGEEWRWRTEESAGVVWNFTQDSSGEYVHNPCSTGGAVWQGVTCSANASHCLTNACSITEIELTSYNLVGSLPPQLGNLSALEWLFLESNMLTGSISSELSRLSRLEALSFDFNMLSGEIPSELGNLSLLSWFSLSSNSISGTISSELCQLQLLEVLNLDVNQLTGSLPPKIGELTALYWVDMDNNGLTGPLPPELGGLVNLQVLEATNNALTGSIPDELDNLSAMEVLLLGSNDLTGSIPDLSNLTRLGWLDLGFNVLSGPIPPGIGNFEAMGVLTLDFNQLSSSVPSVLGNLSSLFWLSMSYNDLTGTIPSALGDLIFLEMLLMDVNILTGTIPRDLGKLHILEAIDLDFNQLTGTISPEFGNISSLFLLDLDNNWLTGSIPPELGKLSRLETLDLDNNVLTGQIPRELCTLSSLYSLDLKHNRLSSIIPSALGNLTALYWLYLSSNELVGQIPPQLSALSNLEILDLESNLLTGLIPSELGSLNVLTVSASVNCLENTIPESFCDLKHIQVLSLNGLGGADGCGSKVTIPLLGTKLQTVAETRIPHCLWNLENLTTLHLTGNGFVGDIDVDSTLSGHLHDLSLSHNHLSGTIPTDIQMMLKVDLSHNRFVGHLSGIDNASNDSKFHAQVNRLSGRLPQQAVSDLDILWGNMFACSTIPANDVNSHGYICGSQLYNYSLYLMVATLLLFCFLVAYCAVKTKIQGFSCLDFDLLKQYPNLENIHGLCTSLLNHAKLLCLLALVIVMSSMPMYLLRITDDSHSYSSHWNVYSWALSFLYMDGSVMAIFALLVWTTGIVVYFGLVYIYWRRKSHDNSLAQRTSAENIETTTWNPRIILAFIGNLCLTLTVNVLYILSTTELSLTISTSFIIRFAMSLFRVVSSAVIIPFLASRISDPVKKSVFLFRLLMLNNTLIPCVVTAMTSSNCFREVLVEPEPIQTVYTYHHCANIAVLPDGSRICLGYMEQTVATSPFVPGYSYNYQCMSAILEAYVPVLIIGFCLQLLLPMLVLTLIKDKHFYAIPEFIRFKLNGLFWPNYWYTMSSSDTMVEPSYLMKTSTIMCRDLLYPLAAIMTFGVCSPSLAFMAAITGVAKCSLWAWAANNFGTIIKERRDSSSADLTKETQLITAFSKVEFPLDVVMKNVFWIILMYSVMFVVLIYADTMGEFGWEIPLTVALFALLLRCIAYYLDAQDFKRSGISQKIEVVSLTQNPIASDIDIGKM